jgi:CBS domain containing-hemolysin-like protein
LITILIVSSAVAIAVSFLCSLSEAVLLSLNPITLNKMQTTMPHAADSWRRLKRSIARPITAILILNTVAHTGGATVAGGAFAQIYGEHNIWIFSILFTMVVLAGTEILPKVIGVAHHARIAPVAGPALEALTAVMKPLIALSTLVFGRLSRSRESDQITTADLVTMASLARSGKAIDLDQENIIVNTVRLGHTRVGHATIPADQVVFSCEGDSPEKVVELARAHGHTRYPVSTTCRLDDVRSYVTIKKALLATPGEVAELLRNARPLHRVNRDTTLLAALKTMLEHREHLLAVTDGSGKCIGIVTLEDISGELLSADIEDFR